MEINMIIAKQNILIKKKTKVCIICPKHGEFWQTPDAHINQKIRMFFM